METQSVNLHVGISSNTSKSRLLEIRGNFYFSCRGILNTSQEKLDLLMERFLILSKAMRIDSCLI